MLELLDEPFTIIYDTSVVYIGPIVGLYVIRYCGYIDGAMNG